MIKRMAEGDIKEALKIIYKKIEEACEKRKPVSFLSPNLCCFYYIYSD